MKKKSENESFTRIQEVAVLSTRPRGRTKETCPYCVCQDLRDAGVPESLSDYRDERKVFINPINSSRKEKRH